MPRPSAQPQASQWCCRSFPPQSSPTPIVCRLRVTVVWRNGQGDERLQELSFVQGAEGYRAALNAPAIGQWRIAMLDGLIPEQVAPCALTVTQPAAETRDPRFDAAALASLTSGSGGRAFTNIDEFVAPLPTC